MRQGPELYNAASALLESATVPVHRSLSTIVGVIAFGSLQKGVRVITRRRHSSCQSGIHVADASIVTHESPCQLPKTVSAISRDETGVRNES